MSAVCDGVAAPKLAVRAILAEILDVIAPQISR